MDHASDIARRRLGLGLAVALTTGLVATSAIAGRPGTPNSEASWSPAPGQMAVRWQNTADEGGIVFDIEGQRDPSVANWSPPGGVGMGTIVTYTFSNLSAGQHCFRMWSRKGAQGERSDQPSAFTCANVASVGSGKSNGGSSGNPGGGKPAPCAGLVCPGGSLTGRRHP